MGSVSSKTHRSSRRLSKSGQGNHQNNHIISDDGDIEVRGHHRQKWSKHESRHANSRPTSASSCTSGSLVSRSSSNLCNQKDRLSDSISSIPTAICMSNNNNKHLSHRIPSPIHIGLQKHDFKVVKLKVGIDKKVTSLDEKSPAVLKYRTPHFRAHATVEIPALADKHSIRLGWIQTCTNMKFVNTYGPEGVTSWEFPEIVSGKFSMISDADGKQYPWYGSKHEVQTVQGPSTKQLLSVHMNDNFFPQVTWYIPHNSFDRSPRLTHIYRNQDFLTFLVVKDLYCDTIHVLKTVRWTMKINIDVNPDHALGRRAKLLEPYDQQAPTILSDENAPHPEPQAMQPPNANNSQTLVWRPIDRSPQIVVPPEQTTVDLDKYLLATKNHIRHLYHQHVAES